MEEILRCMILPDGPAIQFATKQLKEAFKKPETVPALCEVLVSSNSPQIRQTAAVVLRRKLAKKHQWTKLNEETRKSIKQGMLQALVNEQEKLVKNSIAQFIGLLGKHEFPNNTWPEVLHFLNQLCNSENLHDKVLGMYTMSIMTEISKGSYIEHAPMLGSLFTNLLNGLPNSIAYAEQPPVQGGNYTSMFGQTDLNANLAYYTVLTMKHLVSVIGGHPQMINIYQSLFPRVLEIINMHAQKDEKRACELFEIIEDLIECAVAVVVPQVRSIIEMCLRIAHNSEIDKSVQIKAIGVVGWLIRSKSKIVQKNKLIEPTINVVMELMALKPDNDMKEEYFEGDPDQFTLTTIAAQTLDVIAINVPPEKVVPFLLTRIEPALRHESSYQQKAGYLALAVLAEGCADYIRNKYLELFLRCIYDGIRSQKVVVRNAAFFALGQFSEHLQPEISQYSSELLPVFFEYMSHMFTEMQKTKNEPPGLDKMFYALESFCIHLDEGLVPYLPTLMERLFVALDPTSSSLQLKRVALSALESVTCAVKDKLLPYFQKIIEILNLYINADANGDIIELQSYALDCLAGIIENIEGDSMKPLASETLQMSLRILDETDDPDIRKSLYAVFAALSKVINDEISPALPKIVEQMIGTIQSSEGIIAHYDDDDKDGLDIYDELSESDEEEEDIDSESDSSEDSQCRYTVENSYNDEKEQACLSILEICKNIGPRFLPYMDKSFEEIFKLVNYPQEDIRSAAILALEQFCVTLHNVNTQEGKQALYKALQMFIPKCAELIRCDEEQIIVMNATNAYRNLLEEIKGDVLVGEGHREAIMNCVIDILTHKTTCQDQDTATGEHGEENEEESEQTELLLECAGEVLPKFGNALTPDDFVFYFPNILQLMSLRAKNNVSKSQRSFAYGTLAECMMPLGVYIEKFLPKLLQLWNAGAKDATDEVRNNAVFGLGEMILHGKDCIYPHYPDILNGLSAMLASEQHAGTRDNICGAVAKMIIVQHSILPLEQVFTVMLQQLPLKTDFQENAAIIKCFFGLYQQGNEILKTHLRTVIEVAAHIYHNNQTGSDDAMNLLKEFMITVNSDFPQDFAAVISSLGPEVTQNIQKLFRV